MIFFLALLILINLQDFFFGGGDVKIKTKNNLMINLMFHISMGHYINIHALNSNSKIWGEG